LIVNKKWHLLRSQFGLHFSGGIGSDLLRPHEQVNTIVERLREHRFSIRRVLQDRHQAYDVVVRDAHARKHIVEEAFELLVSALLVLLVQNVEELLKVGLD